MTPLSCATRLALIGALSCALSPLLIACDDDPQPTPTPEAGATLDLSVGEGLDMEPITPDMEPVTSDMEPITPDMGADMEPVSFPNAPGGNPLNPEVALAPYPSDYFLIDDPNSPTGKRLNLPDEALFRQTPGAFFNTQDGFSRMPMIVSVWPRGVSQESLPSVVDHGESLLDTSTTLLIEQGTLRRIPHLAEIDLTSGDPLKAALIMRPLVTLEPNTSYTVLIQRGLSDAEGVAYEPNEAFEALKRGESTGDEALDRALSSFEGTRTAVEGSGLSVDDALLAWSFHTRSRASVTGALLKLQDAANRWPLGEFVITSDEVVGENRQLQGELDAPLYNGPDGISFDEAGEPQQLGVERFPFSMTIPLSVSERGEPRPVLIYGHGFLGTHPQATRSSFNELCRRGAISAIGLNFGMYEALFPDLVKALNGEAEFFARIRGGVMQSMVNSSVAGRYMREALSERFPEINPQDVQYLGISNGGTFGALFAATTHVVSKATLVVGGGGLSHFLQRASQWNDLGFLARRNFSDPRELQLYLALLQEQLDPIDPINYVDHLISPRFEGRGPMRASLHMAVNDSQVHNLVSEWVARTAGVPLLTPSAKPIWGLEEISAPLSDEDALALPSALVVYDEMLAPYPGGNVAPLEDNGGHGTIRQLESYQLNVLDFINEGKLNQHCEGPCDPN